MIKNKLQQIDNLKNELDALSSLKKELLDSIKTMYDVELTYNSNAIDGSSLDFVVTKMILIDGIVVSGKTIKEMLYTINHKSAIDYVEETAKRKTKSIKQADVLAIHKILLRGIDDTNAGHYRDYNNNIGHKENRNRFTTQNLMDNFYLWLKENKNMHPVLLATEAHYRFISIHPFIDGNGRCARLLMNLILIQNGYPPAVIKMSKRREYIDAVQKADNKNMNDFYNFVADAELESLELCLETVNKDIIWK